MSAFDVAWYVLEALEVWGKGKTKGIRMAQDDETGFVVKTVEDGIRRIQPNSSLSSAKAKITNSPTRLPRTLQPHHFRHMISGTLVFLAGVGADFLVMHLHRTWPRPVQWHDGTVQEKYQVTNHGLPPQGVKVDLGVCADGLIVWRVHQ